MSTVITIDPKDIVTFQQTVLDRYTENKRELPWRDTTNSYHVLVSEIMSQQTQVSRVIPKYHAFLQTAPDYKTLAYLDKTTLLTLRSGLGYNNRALRLQLCARTIHEEHNDILPRDEKTLLALPGIGKYTAHALLAFVYNMDVPVLDINIRRVICHHFSIDPNIKDKELRQVAFTLIPPGKSKDWHNALMDYGSLVYTSKKTGIKSQSQSPFKGSRRRVRGGILKQLVNNGPQHLITMKKQFPHKEFDSILQTMIADELIDVKEDTITIHQ